MFCAEGPSDTKDAFIHLELKVFNNQLTIFVPRRDLLFSFVSLIEVNSVYRIDQRSSTFYMRNYMFVTCFYMF